MAKESHVSTASAPSLTVTILSEVGRILGGPNMKTLANQRGVLSSRDQMPCCDWSPGLGADLLVAGDGDPAGVVPHRGRPQHEGEGAGVAQHLVLVTVPGNTYDDEMMTAMQNKFVLLCVKH